MWEILCPALHQHLLTIGSFSWCHSDIWLPPQCYGSISIQTPRDDFSSSHYGRFDKDYVFPLWDAWCVVQRTKHASKPTKVLICHYGSLCYIMGHRGWQCGQICQSMICFVLCKLLNKFVCIWYKFLSHTVLICFVLLTILCKYW